MLLYVVHDSSNQTLSLPLLAPDFDVAQSALIELNPSNLSSLSILPITTLEHPSQLLQLQVNKSLPLPDQLSRSAEVTPSATPQTPVRESPSHD